MGVLHEAEELGEGVVLLQTRMNFIRTVKLLRRAQRLFGLFEEASVSKSLFASKVFWFNVLTAAAELTSVLPLPPGTVVIAASVINIALRFVTTKPVHVVSPN